jgi:hypothetical protein
MTDSTSLSLLKSVINNQSDLIVIFDSEDPILTNASFNSFFGVSSFEDYKLNFGPFVENFVPHPSYFHKEKVEKGETWFEAILKLEKDDRLVSMMTQSFEPHAFSVIVGEKIENYRVVTFDDVTQNLIKRIMIENKSNLDKRSGAYDKNYFLHIAQSFEDAAIFNEKMIGLIDIIIDKNVELNEDILREFVQKIKYETRKDDMLIRWGENKFLLAFIVEDQPKAKQVVAKIESMKHDTLEYSVSCSIQNEGESIQSMIKRLR